jgi:hypothetical protein
LPCRRPRACGGGTRHPSGRQRGVQRSKSPGASTCLRETRASLRTAKITAAAVMNEVREAAAKVVHGLYRVVKACLIHNASNEAVSSLGASGAAAVDAYCACAGVSGAALLFIGDAAFVNRRLLGASRETYALAAELGQILHACDLSEVTLAEGVTREALVTFARALAEAWRDRSASPRLLAERFPCVTVRRVRVQSGSAEVGSPAAVAARTYAAAIVGMRAAGAEMKLGAEALGGPELPRRIKRIAQKLVTLTEKDGRLLAALTVVVTERDDAAVSVASAALAVAMARQLTTDRVLLASLGMTALLYGAGRRRLTGAAEIGAGFDRALNDDELDRAPASAAFELAVMGKLHAPARMRAALVYESLWRRRSHRLGPVYGGRRSPSLASHILTVARTFAELRAAAVGELPLGLDEAVHRVQSAATGMTERTTVKLLIGALGILPLGTMVELNTGEMGVVLTTPSLPIDFARPAVRVLYNEGANLLETPFDVDLARPPKGSAPMRVIRRVVSTDAGQEKIMRDEVLSLMAQKERGSPSAPSPPPKRRSSSTSLPRVTRPSKPTMPSPRMPSSDGLPAGRPERTPKPRAPRRGTPPPGSVRVPPKEHGAESRALSSGEYRELLVSRHPSSPGTERPMSQERVREARPAEQPASSRPPLSERDKLLEAFLKDAPFADVAEDSAPPRGPERRKSRPTLPAVNVPHRTRKPR